MSGPLALVGGAEFMAGNDDQDRLLVAAAAGRPAYVVCAAAREHPDQAAATARRWFKRLGVEMSELRVRSRADASVAATVAEARGAGLVYLAGGDPGRTVQLLTGSAVWAAVLEAWRDGAALAGSSAGAMALCRWTLVRDRWPRSEVRRPVDALAVVPDGAVLPHFDSFGERWIPSAQAALGGDVPLIGVDERSAAVWHEGRWTAMGPGAVNVVRGPAAETYAKGAIITGLPAPVS